MSIKLGADHGDVKEIHEIIDFIKSITVSTRDSVEKWHGDRAMIDLCKVVKRYYYDPLTNGSNSIKKVFPAILTRSEFLQSKYGKPIYGGDGGIPSLNFKKQQWVKKEGGIIADPYTLLQPLFKDIDITERELEFLYGDTVLKEGGAASIAYARMQFSEMHHNERVELIGALLRYCELDTLAMVMIVEAWMHMTYRL